MIGTPFQASGYDRPTQARSSRDTLAEKIVTGAEYRHWLWHSGGVFAHRNSPAISKASSGELVEQCLRFLQVAGVKPFGEPGVNRREKITGFGVPALATVEPGQFYGGAQFER